MKTLIHVNQRAIKAHRKTGTREPGLTVNTYKSNTYGYEAVIRDAQGRESPVSSTGLIGPCSRLDRDPSCRRGRVYFDRARRHSVSRSHDRRWWRPHRLMRSFFVQ